MAATACLLRSLSPASPRNDASKAFARCARIWLKKTAKVSADVLRAFAARKASVYMRPVHLLSQPAPSAKVDPPVPTEIVRRPEPGIGRGLWEAPPAFFYVAGSIAVIVGVLYALWRKGLVRFRFRRSSEKRRT